MEQTHKKNIVFLIFMIIIFSLLSLAVCREMDHAFFSRNPVLDEKSYLQSAISLITQGLPDRPFYQSPLYPFIIAGLFLTAGTSPEIVHLFHIFCGAGSLLLIFAAAKILWNNKAARISLFLMLFSGIFYFYQALILKVSISLTAFMAFLILFLIFLKTQRLWPLFFSGLFLALLCLLRENALIIILAPVFSLLFISAKKNKKILFLAIFTAAFLAGIAPVACFNTIRSGRLMLTSSQAGHNFYIGNNPASYGRYTEVKGVVGNNPASYGRYTEVKGVVGNPLVQEQNFLKISQKESGKEQTGLYWFQKTFETMRSHKKKFARLLFIKSLLIANDYEIPNNRNYYFEKRFSSPLLHFLPLSFGMLLPFACIGIIQAIKNRKPAELFLIMVMVTYAISLILFYVLSRYRILLWPPVIMFGARGIMLTAKAIRKKEFVRISVFTAMILIVSCLSFHVVEIEGRINPFPSFSREELNKKEYSYVLYNMGIILYNRGEIVKAKGIFQTLVSINPDYTPAYYLMARINHRMENIPEMVRNYTLVLRRRKDMMQPQDFELYDKYSGKTCND